MRAASRGDCGWFTRPGPAEVTRFARDLVLLLKAGARLDDALELLASDSDVGRLRPVVGKLRAALLSGESLAGGVGDQRALFPPMYVALVRVGEVSGTLDQVLEMLGAERARAELMRRKLMDAMQYPAFVLIAALCVMLFFILFVLPQFSSVLQDFGAKSDSALSVFIKLSDFLRANATAVLLGSASAIAGIWWLMRRPGAGAAVVNAVSQIPGIAGIFGFYRTTLFCRNLGVLLGSGVNLTATLRILVDIMAVTGSVATWTAPADRRGHGAHLIGPRVLNYLSESKVKAAKIQLQSFGSALDLFYLDAGRFPSTAEGLTALVQRTPGVAAWNGPYLKGGNVPNDPWNNAYIYRSPGERSPYEIMSYGSDGQEGGTGIAADIST